MVVKLQQAVSVIESSKGFAVPGIGLPVFLSIRRAVAVGAHH